VQLGFSVGISDRTDTSHLLEDIAWLDSLEDETTMLSKSLSGVIREQKRIARISGQVVSNIQTCLDFAGKKPEYGVVREKMVEFQQKVSDIRARSQASSEEEPGEMSGDNLVKYFEKAKADLNRAKDVVDDYQVYNQSIRLGFEIAKRQKNTK